MSSKISKVLQERHSDLVACGIYSAQLVDRLYSKSCMSEEEMAKVRSAGTDFDKSRELLRILRTKQDSVLEVLLECLAEEVSWSHLTKIISNCVQQLECSADTEHGSSNAGRMKTQILPEKWWPVNEKKETPKSFVKRKFGSDEDLLVTHLRRQLLSTDGQVTAIVARKQAIVGTGGIGKTTTAAWYANFYEDKYDQIIWIDSEGEALPQSLERLGRELNITRTSSDKLRHYVGQIYNHLHDVRCLFVFDNVEAEYIEADKMSNFLGLLPRNEHHHSLITSRYQNWGHANETGVIPTFRLDVFTGPECVSLLFGALEAAGKADTEEDMLALGTELGFLPLALQCAVATILRSSSYTVKGYLEKIRTDVKILVDKRILNGYERSITATFQISIEQIERSKDINESLKKLCKLTLNIAAYCKPDDISDRLLHEITNSDHDLNEALDLLVSYSFLTIQGRRPYWSGNIYRIHRLLQYAIRETVVGGKEFVLEAVGLILQERSKYVDHAKRAWKLAGEKFDEILLQWPNIPNDMLTINGGISEIQFLKTAITNLSRVYKLWDLPLIQVKLGLVYTLRKNYAETEAEDICGTLCQLLMDSSHVIPSRDEILLHVKLFSLKMYEIQYPSEFLPTHHDILDRVIESGYDGTIEGAAMCFPMSYIYKDLGFKRFMHMQSIRSLCERGLTQKAIKSIEELINRVGIVEINVISYFLFKNRSNSRTEKLLKSVSSTVYQKIKTLVSGAFSSGIPNFKLGWCVLQAGLLQFHWLQKEACPIKDYLDMLSFLTTFLSPRSSSMNVVQANRIITLLTRIAAFLLKSNMLSQENLVFIADEFDHIWTNFVKNNGRHFHVLASSVLNMNVVHSFILLKIGDIKKVLELDSKIIQILDMPVNSLVVKFHWEILPPDNFWDGEEPFTTKEIILLSSQRSNFYNERVLESKLKLSLKIIQQSHNFIRREDYLPRQISSYDDACCIYLIQSRMNEAVLMWREGLNFLVEGCDEVNKSIELVSEFGKEFLQLLEQSQDEQTMQICANLLTNCVDDLMNRKLEVGQGR